MLGCGREGGSSARCSAGDAFLFLFSFSFIYFFYDGLRFPCLALSFGSCLHLPRAVTTHPVYTVPGIEPRALCKLGKCCTISAILPRAAASVLGLQLWIKLGDSRHFLEEPERERHSLGPAVSRMLLKKHRLIRPL